MSVRADVSALIVVAVHALGLSSDADLNPLRLCPRASIPSDVVSRCTWPGPGPRTSRATNTMSRGSECMDTPEVERMTSLELVASALEAPRSAC